MKRQLRLVALLLAVLLLLPGAAAYAAPAIHAIDYPENYPSAADEDGADAFGGSLNHPQSAYYAINDYYNMESEDSLHILEKFETYQQTTEYSCGPSCALMVLNRFGADDYNELQLAEMMGSDHSRGTSVEGMAKFFTDQGWSVEVNASTEPKFADFHEAESFLIEKLDAGVPVLVNWEDWRGHWQVVIGLDTCGTEDPYDDVVILADPYDVTDHYQDGYYIFPFGRFFDMWREGPCAAKTEPYVQAYVVARPAA